jgi:hypothetical protein
MLRLATDARLRILSSADEVDIHRRTICAASQRTEQQEGRHRQQQSRHFVTTGHVFHAL